MSQQLIIQNDEEADYVQFTVEIPDGYAGFNISSINGTMINQNYLNIGDVLRFKFSNNPIIYNDAPYITLTDYTSDVRLTTTRNDDTDYEFMKFDLFNIYRVKFIPIYSYYDSDEGLSGYIFNPADDSQLLLEPTRKIPDYAIQTGDNPIYASFTGAFIIGLDKVDKIDGHSLMSEAEHSKLEGIEAGAQKNFIKTVDTAQFNVYASGNLTLLDIAQSKVTGLADVLNGKVDKIDGHRLITAEEAKKLEALSIDENGSVGISGTVNASRV